MVLHIASGQLLLWAMHYFLYYVHVCHLSLSVEYCSGYFFKDRTLSQEHVIQSRFCLDSRHRDNATTIGPDEMVWQWYVVGTRGRASADDCN